MVGVEAFAGSLYNEAAEAQMRDEYIQACMRPELRYRYQQFVHHQRLQRAAELAGRAGGARSVLEDTPTFDHAGQPQQQQPGHDPGRMMTTESTPDQAPGQGGEHAVEQQQLEGDDADDEETGYDAGQQAGDYFPRQQAAEGGNCDGHGPGGGDGAAAMQAAAPLFAPSGPVFPAPTRPAEDPNYAPPPSMTPLARSVPQQVPQRKSGWEPWPSMQG